MAKMAEIEIVSPERLKISVPQQILDELGRLIDPRNLDAIITEALADQLKRIRFRTDLEKVSIKLGLSLPPLYEREGREEVQQLI